MNTGESHSAVHLHLKDNDNNGPIAADAGCMRREENHSIKVEHLSQQNSWPKSVVHTLGEVRPCLTTAQSPKCSRGRRSTSLTGWFLWAKGHAACFLTSSLLHHIISVDNNGTVLIQLWFPQVQDTVTQASLLSGLGSKHFSSSWSVFTSQSHHCFSHFPLTYFCRIQISAYSDFFFSHTSMTSLNKVINRTPFLILSTNVSKLGGCLNRLHKIRRKK